jgi:2-polyprenyl-6-methoxyphenol hydroxylase-like FAD-dependent oxidoreductase
MKIVIIGGGIAGLSLALFLQKNHIDVSVNERAADMPDGGNAFLMHSDGLLILKELTGDSGIALPGKMVAQFSLKNPHGDELQAIKLGSWQCIKRKDLTDFLYSLLAEPVMNGRDFSHFRYEGNKAVAAVFTNGEVEYGDVFVGADGGFSKVRTELMGPIAFKPGGVKEIVGIANAENIALEYAGIFTKFQLQTSGLAFGMIPTSETELVWFMQYDPSVKEVEAHTPAALNAFCHDMLRDFPSVVHEVLNANDRNKTYLWNTRDFDLLPHFHKNNVVLIGDAAHLALPFTSAGTTNAMVDAKVLASLLLAGLPCLNDAFEQFYAIRAAEVLKHLEFGRKLREVFLNPAAHEGEEVAVPLIG